MFVGLIAHGSNLALDVTPITAKRFADVDDHVDLDSAIAAGQLCFAAFHFGETVAVRETNYGAYQHAAAAQQLGSAFDEVRFDADRRDAVSRGQPAALLQLLVG